MVRYRDEPCTIDAHVVSEYLDRIGMPSMANFVRHLGLRCQRDNETEMRLQSRIRELEQRYEPRTIEKIHDPTPPPEASD